jgi:hypothetical protein
MSWSPDFGIPQKETFMPNAGKLNYYVVGQPTTLFSEPSYTGTFT